MVKIRAKRVAEEGVPCCKSWVCYKYHIKTPYNVFHYAEFVCENGIPNSASIYTGNEVDEVLAFDWLKLERPACVCTAMYHEFDNSNSLYT
jgi:hypothetical protein